MATRIRLQRHGRKKAPFYFIVVADQRAKRDGKYIDRIGSYDPTTVPATIELNADKALEWIQKGAQPSDTARAILKYKGVMFKKHLMRGVSKGAFDEKTAENMFNTWMEDKENRIKEHEVKAEKARMDEIAAKAAAGAAKAEARAKKIAAKLQADVPVEATEGEAEPEAERDILAEASAGDGTISEGNAAAAAAVVAATEVAEEAKEEVAEKVEEAKAAVDEKVEEAKEETPEEQAAEVKAEDTEEAAPVAEKSEEPVKEEE